MQHVDHKTPSWLFALYVAVYFLKLELRWARDVVWSERTQRKTAKRAR